MYTDSMVYIDFIIILLVSIEPSNDEIQENMQILTDFCELERQFTSMLVIFKKNFEGKDFEEARSLLAEVFPSGKLLSCKDIDELFRTLQEQHLNVFNIYALEVLEKKFPIDEEVRKLFDKLAATKKRFLYTRIEAFELAVCCRPLKPSLPEMDKLEIKLSTAAAKKRTMLELQSLTHPLIEPKYLGDVEATTGCITVSWLYPAYCTFELKSSARSIGNHFSQHSWIMEVKIAGTIFYPEMVCYFEI